MKKKINLISVLSLLIVLVFTNSVFADNTIYTNGNFKFILNDDETITIVEYFGKEDTAEIPMLIGGYPVVNISKDTFKENKIKEIKIPETLSIEEVQSAVGEQAQIETFNRDNEIINTILPKQESENPVEPKAIPKQDTSNDNINNQTTDDNQETINNIVIADNDSNVDDAVFDEDVVEEDVIEQQEVETTSNHNNKEKISNTYIYVILVVVIACILILIYIRKKN